jgi:membrane protein
VTRDQLTRVASKGEGTLGVTFAIGLAVSLWSANAAMKSLFDTLNIVYAEEEKKGFIKLNRFRSRLPQQRSIFWSPLPRSPSCR